MFPETHYKYTSKTSNFKMYNYWSPLTIDSRVELMVLGALIYKDSSTRRCIQNNCLYFSTNSYVVNVIQIVSPRRLGINDHVTYGVVENLWHGCNNSLIAHDCLEHWIQFWLSLLDCVFSAAPLIIFLYSYTLVYQSSSPIIKYIHKI